MTMTTGALSGLSILELGSMVAAPYCAKLLADLGADVVKVEAPESGDPARRRGPFPGDVPHPERSALFLYLNTSKRGVTLDLGTEAGRGIFLELVREVDVLIEDRAPGELERIGLGYARLSELDPRLIVTSITPFGQTGPHRDHRGHHLNLYHGSGYSSPFHLPGDEDRPPPKGGGYLGDYDAGLTAAIGTIAAVIGRAASGRGEHVDVSKQEAMMCMERVDIGRLTNDPNPQPRRMVGGLTRAKDGYFMVTPLESHQWESLVRAMGEPEWSKAEWCKDELGRLEHREEARDHIAEWAADLSREEIYHLCQAEGTPAGPVRNVAEVRAWEQAKAREFFVELEHPEAGSQVYPTAPYRFSKTPWAGSRAPLLGEHNQEVYGEGLGRSPGACASGGGGSDLMQEARGRQGPLSGIRVTDFTWAWAGPHGTLLLAMLGAEVIKIESHARLDHARVHSLAAGAVSRGVDESPFFNDLNLGKLSITLDLRKEEARDSARRLVAGSDVVTQNMRPGVLDRLGLGYQALRAVKPDIVMLSSSAVGATGPEGSYVGYAPTFACMSGAVEITGYPDEPPSPLSGSVDLGVGTTAAFAVLAALHHRQRTGEGQHIDLSSTEVMSAMIGDAFLEYSLCDRLPERRGNRDSSMAPHNCYRCKGEEQWLTIAVGTEAEWRALRTVIDDPELGDEQLAGPLGRWQHQDRLDAVIERWTRQREPREAMEILQRAGVAAMVVHTGASIGVDPHVRRRGVFQKVTHPRLGERAVVRPPWRLEGVGVRGAAPTIGEHTEYILEEILGLSRDEIDRLEEAGVLH